MRIETDPFGIETDPLYMNCLGLKQIHLMRIETDPFGIETDPLYMNCLGLKQIHLMRIETDPLKKAYDEAIGDSLMRGIQLLVKEKPGSVEI